jgi:uncharacterized protein (TIGR02145 family)
MGAEERALITDVIATGATASTVTGHRGFWLETSGDNGSATVTATLSLADGVEHFNWCVYAFDYPPNAVLQSDGTYQLRGSPPFTINGDIIEHSNTFGPGTCITSITDATDNPEGIVPAPFSAGSITTAGTATFVGIASAAIVADAAPASGGDGRITYLWQRSDGTASTTLTCSSATYALSEDSENYTTAGTYYFTRYAKDGCNATFTPSGGQYTLRVVPDATLPPYSSTLTWTVGTQIWSGALSNPVAGCVSTTNFGSDYVPSNAYYLKSGLYSGSGYLYNGKCVNDRKSTLCPTPWRVPTLADLVTLDKALGGTGVTGELNQPVSHAGAYVGIWGGVYGGVYTIQTLNNAGSHMVYWTCETSDTAAIYILRVTTANVVNVGEIRQPRNGMQVRCVY